MLNLGFIQYAPKWEDKAANQEQILTILNIYQANLNQLDWLIFPEMTLTGFSLNSAVTTLTPNDLTFFQNIAQKYQIHLSFGIVQNQQNCLITLNPNGEIFHQYAKRHLFSYANEHKTYLPGDKTTGFKINDFHITPSICYDLRFTDLFWPNAAQTDLFLNIANWPKTRNLHWQTLLKARAIENQAFVLGVNRLGTDPQNNYQGNSLLIDPFGKIKLAAKNQTGLFTACLNKKTVQQTRIKFPFLADRGYN
jgi:predicted amidohydrolase